MYMNGTHRNTCTIHAGYMQDTWDTYRIGNYTKTYRKPHVTPSSAAAAASYSVGTRDALCSSGPPRLEATATVGQ